MKKFKSSNLLTFIPLQAVTLSPESWNELVVINANKEYKASSGVIQVLKRTNSFTKVVAFFLQLFPISFLDKLYYLLARNRFKWFGESKACSIN